MTPSSPGGPVDLLVVTADPQYGEDLSTLLGAGFELTFVGTPDEALAELGSSGEIQCIVSDHDPPEIDALAFLERVRRPYPTLPFVLFTDEGSEAVASEAISAGVTDYVEQRNDRDQSRLLTNRIENAIDQYRTVLKAERSQNRLAAIVDANPDFVFIFDEDAVYQEILAGEEHITAYPTDQFIGSSVGDLWPDPAATTLREAIQTTARTGDHQRIEYQLPIDGQGTQNGGVEWFEGRTAPIDFDDPDQQFVLLSARDITARKEMEADLLRTQRAVEASGHAIYITDLDGRIEYVNPAFEEITGYTADEAIGRNPRILKSGEMSDDYYEDLWETLLDGGVWEEELVNRRKNGELYHAHQTIAPVEDPQGDVTAYVAIQTEITERKHLEWELRESLTQLQVIDRVLRHNLHNDMNVILGYADTIREQATGDTATHAETIARESENLLATVDKEREITELLSDPEPIQPVDLGHLVKSVVLELRDRYRSAELSVHQPESVTVKAMPALGRAVEELVTNAVVHSDRETPTVEVTLAVEDETAELRIADDGPGIPDMERRILTEEAEIEPLYHGSGLGLWLVRLIVQKSGGSLDFERNDPRGSVVLLRLPISNEDDAHAVTG